MWAQVQAGGKQNGNQNTVRIRLCGGLLLLVSTITGAAATNTEFPTPTANSAPNGITVGFDGNLWFTENNDINTGRITIKFRPPEEL